jgi:predicted phage tail protein
VADTHGGICDHDAISPSPSHRHCLGRCDGDGCRAGVRLGAAPPPTYVTATHVAADVEVDVAWVDASTDETSFVIERCHGVDCTSFTQLTAWPALTGTGSHPRYADSTGLKAGRTYYYRVGAVNSFGVTYSPTVAVLTR